MYHTYIVYTIKIIKLQNKCILRIPTIWFIYDISYKLPLEKLNFTQNSQRFV